MTDQARPFRILGLQQIALGGRDKEDHRRLWVDLFGIDPVGSYRSEKENVDEDILRIGKGVHAVEVDLMMPIDAEKSPNVQTPALNHIGLWVDDIGAAVSYLEAAGVRFTAGRYSKGCRWSRRMLYSPERK